MPISVRKTGSDRYEATNSEFPGVVAEWYVGSHTVNWYETGHPRRALTASSFGSFAKERTTVPEFRGYIARTGLWRDLIGGVYGAERRRHPSDRGERRGVQTELARRARQARTQARRKDGRFK